MATFIKNMGGSNCCDCTGRINPCDTCSCPFPTINSRFATSTLLKNGWFAFDTPIPHTGPVQVYLVKSLSGFLVNWDNCTTCNNSSEFIFSGSCEYYRPSTGSASPDVVGGLMSYQYWKSSCLVPNGSGSTATCDVSSAPVFTNETHSSTLKTINGDACVSGTLNYGTAYETLSSQYTTAQLSSDVDSNLATKPWSSWGSGSYLARYFVYFDETYITKTKTEYKFILPSLPSGSCYKITWSEKYTRTLDGAIVYTSKSYTWNGVDTETPVYHIDPPSEPGSTDPVTSLSVNCSCP